MKTHTWSADSTHPLDVLFEDLRLQHYNDKTHRLWSNYDEGFLKFCIAKTICFDENQQAIMCSSIASRDCWPSQIYRIMNRTWKPNTRLSIATKLSKFTIATAQSQIDWLNENLKYKIAFISRQTNHWQDLLITNFNNNGFRFEKDKYYYLTCPNECDNTCWQKIIYQGDDELLKFWKRKE